MSGAEFDFSQFEAFASKFNKSLQEENFLMDVMSKLGNVMIRTVKENTPEGQYDGKVFFVTTNGKLAVFDGGAKKTGGTLRRNWTLDGVSKDGGGYVVTISNNTEYAGYVEHGHRTVNGGWVEGRFFLKITMEDIMAQLPSIVGPMYQSYLRKFGFD